MIDRERSFTRETLDLYVVDPEEMSLPRMKEQIDMFLTSGLPQAVKDEAFMLRNEDCDGFPSWKLVYDRPETDEQMRERIANEEHRAWIEIGRLAKELRKAPRMPDVDDEVADEVTLAILTIADAADRIVPPGSRFSPYDVRQAIAAAMASQEKDENS